MIQAAELRERLRLYENHNVLPDNLESLPDLREDDQVGMMRNETDR